jgi:hypothetical protein
MAAEQHSSNPRQAPPSALGRWLRVAAGAALLLALSQALWLWQSWPVRELLAPPGPSTPIASGR